MQGKIDKAVFTTVGPVRLVQACSCARKSRFNLRGGAGKHLQACLGALEDRESSFHRCGGPVKLVKDCLFAGKP